MVGPLAPAAALAAPISASISPGAAGLLAGSALATGLGSAISANAEEAVAKEAALGPVRGGSTRAGNPSNISLKPDQSTLEKIGQVTLPVNPPAYGANPVDLRELFKKQQFGQGYSPNQYFQTNRKYV